MKRMLTIRVDVDLADRISDLAHDLRVSVNVLVTLLIEHAVENGIGAKVESKTRKRKTRFPIDEQTKKAVLDRYVRQQHSRHRIYRELGVCDCTTLRILKEARVQIRGPEEALRLRDSRTDCGAYMPNNAAIQQTAKLIRNRWAK